MSNRNHNETKRGFYITNESWYFSPSLLNPDENFEILIGMFDEDGSATGEFKVVWVDISGKSTPKLEAFNDSWSALLEFPDVLQFMKDVDSERVSPREFALKLVSFGVSDLTKRIRND